MTGIYKITNPQGRIYIGQSIDITRRFSQYKRIDCKQQVRLYRSLLKYGVENHTFEIIYKCEKSDLNKMERYYQEFFNSTGSNGLNCSLTQTDALSYEHSDLTKKKMSEIKKGKKLNPEWAAKVRLNLEKSRGRKNTEEQKQKRLETLKKNGYKTSNEIMEKMWNATRGIKRSDETLKKMSIAMKNRPSFSDEWRRKIGEKSKGRIFSEESKKKISLHSAKNSSKLVLNLEMGIYFDSAKEAAAALGFNHSTFKSMLNGSIKTNRTNCIYC